LVLRSLAPLRPKLTVVIEESTNITREEQKGELRNLKSMQVEGFHRKHGLTLLAYDSAAFVNKNIASRQIVK